MSTSANASTSASGPSTSRPRTRRPPESQASESVWGPSHWEKQKAKHLETLRRDRQARNKNPLTGLSTNSTTDTRDRDRVIGSRIEIDVDSDDSQYEDEVAVRPRPGASSVVFPDQSAEARERRRREMAWLEKRKAEVDAFSILDSSYEVAERRAWAATILDSPELLMMHALSRNDSIPATKLHFTLILSGYDHRSPRSRNKSGTSKTSKNKNKNKIAPPKDATWRGQGRPGSPSRFSHGFPGRDSYRRRREQGLLATHDGFDDDDDDEEEDGDDEGEGDGDVEEEEEVDMGGAAAGYSIDSNAAMLGAVYALHAGGGSGSGHVNVGMNAAGAGAGAAGGSGAASGHPVVVEDDEDEVMSDASSEL